MMLAAAWYEVTGTWIAALLTIAILSFLYKDNVVYKVAEHLFVGVAAGYTIAYSFHEVFVKNLYRPLFEGKIIVEEGQWGHPQMWRFLLVIPLFLGLLFFARFSKNFNWLSRWSIAFLVGLYAGVNCTAYFHSDLVIQTSATFYSLNPNDVGASQVFLYNLPILFGVLASLTYFFFSKPHTGFIGITARIGIYFLMAAFGASFGYTVMARVSLFIGRVYFLVEDWIKAYII